MQIRCFGYYKNMRVKKFLLVIVMCVGYGIVSLYTAYIMLKQREENHSAPNTRVLSRDLNSVNISAKHVQIWDVGNIGSYLWQDILQGKLPNTERNRWSQSALTLQGFSFWYRQSHNLQPKHAPHFIDDCLILAIDAHDKSTQQNAKAWMDYTLGLEHLLRIGLLVMGEVTCENDWLQPYLKLEKIKFVFLMYDSPIIDNKKVFAWPLGPTPEGNQDLQEQFKSLDISAPRKYTCNFIGTIYPKTSRQNIMDLSNDKVAQKCYFAWRNRFVQTQGKQSFSYQQVISDSDLTISPTCLNSECFRTYEAIALGSIPVIEDIVLPKNCNSTDSAPYALLKKSKAPVMFIKNFEKDLPTFLDEFEALSSYQKVRKRLSLLKWYIGFKMDLQKQFISIVQERFLNPSR